MESEENKETLSLAFAQTLEIAKNAITTLPPHGCYYIYIDISIGRITLSFLLSANKSPMFTQMVFSRCANNPLTSRVAPAGGLADAVTILNRHMPGWQRILVLRKFAAKELFEMICCRSL
jgi:hypothetical protein